MSSYELHRNVKEIEELWVTKDDIITQYFFDCM